MLAGSCAHAACPASPHVLAEPTQAALVAAIECANAATGEYVVDLGAQTVTLTAVHGEDAYSVPLGLPEVAGRMRLVNGAVMRDPASPLMRVLTVLESASLVVDSVTVSGGRIEGSGYRGGNIDNMGSLEVRDSRVVDGEADIGGGINNDGSLLLINSEVRGNRARYGGGLSSGGTRTVVVASTFEGNEAPEPGEGGAIYNSRSLDVIASRIAGNLAFVGGGITSSLGNARISNSLVVGNSGVLGGGIHSSHATLHATNVTVAGNSGGPGAGGFYLNYGDVTINNSIAYGNSNNGDGNPDITGFSGAGQGNLFGIDPGFVEMVPAVFAAPTVLGDYRLAAGGMAIDAGVDAVAPPRHRSDYFGGQRHEGERIDVGADEFGDSRVLSNGFEARGTEFLR